jgi:hypothetical protein
MLLTSVLDRSAAGCTACPAGKFKSSSGNAACSRECSHFRASWSHVLSVLRSLSHQHVVGGASHRVHILPSEFGIVRAKHLNQCLRVQRRSVPFVLC